MWRVLRTNVEYGLGMTMGLTGHDSGPSTNQWVRVALRVERNPGEPVVWGTDCHVANLLGPTNECI